MGGCGSTRNQADSSQNSSNQSDMMHSQPEGGESSPKKASEGDIEELVRYLFDLLDVNKDQLLLSHEFLTTFPRTAKTVFDVLDLNKDKRIEFDEFKQSFVHKDLLNLAFLTKFTKSITEKIMGDQAREIEFQAQKNMLMKSELTRFVDPDDWQSLELTPFQLHKIKYLFSLWRTDDAGIQKDDLFKRFKKIAQENKVEWKRVKRSAEKFWKSITLQPNDDKICTEDMFVDAWKFFINSQVIWDYYDEFRKDLFFYKLCNVDDSGYFYETEWNNLMTNLGVDMLDAGQAFINIDQNDDAVVSEREFRVALVNFICSNDIKNLASNTLFGPLPEFKASDYIKKVDEQPNERKQSGWFNFMNRSIKE